MEICRYFNSLPLNVRRSARQEQAVTADQDLNVIEHSGLYNIRSSFPNIFY